MPTGTKSKCLSAFLLQEIRVVYSKYQIENIVFDKFKIYEIELEFDKSNEILI